MEMPQEERFSIRLYFRTLTQVLGQPSQFFSEQPREVGLKRPLTFLTVSAIIFTIASLANNHPPNPLTIGMVFFINAVGMVFISSGIGYMIMTMSIGKRVTYVKFFSIYAFATGVTLLSSWVPFFIFITEPWKWYLIGRGLTKSCGLNWKQTLMVIIGSLIVIFLFFLSVLPAMKITLE